MKKLLIILVFAIFSLIALIFIWRNLPVSIIRYSDIKLGNTVIQNIDNYYKVNGKLPNETDWATLKKMKFEFDYWVMRPQYSQLSETTYELCFAEGFDGPYLMWNSTERKWKIDSPSYTHYKDPTSIKKDSLNNTTTKPITNTTK